MCSFKYLPQVGFRRFQQSPTTVHKSENQFRFTGFTRSIASVETSVSAFGLGNQPLNDLTVVVRSVTHLAFVVEARAVFFMLQRAPSEPVSTAQANRRFAFTPLNVGSTSQTFAAELIPTRQNKF